MIAMALASNPEILIADEPTTALDVTIQFQIIEELKKLQKESHMSIIFINHDLGLIAELCDKVMIMYAGEIVEEAELKTIFSNPIHPYTQMLLKSVPKINERRGKLTEIPGYVPSPKNYPSGCKFSPRCPKARNNCHNKKPKKQSISPNHLFKCWYPDK
jgi:oligopeptide/dipeptide ABC transporter ATP-binding protein